MNVRNREKWYKSSRSLNDGDCVEVSVGVTSAGIRDSQDPLGPSFRVPMRQWLAFMQSVLDFADAKELVTTKATLDKTKVRTMIPGSDVYWCRSSGPPDAGALEFGFISVSQAAYVVVRCAGESVNVLVFTVDEWRAFIDGIRRNEFLPALTPAGCG
ncbi:DUF397 domain-containing protein [Amycolatopsis sp. lyj-108]|uniref:DUF397 domain-containing protein n=1 Tax=Amycolatopsis sp. lyj-108 TaxID=2789286 RepID=UPI0039787E5E